MINGWILLIDCFGFEDVYAVTSCTIRASTRLIDDGFIYRVGGDVLVSLVREGILGKDVKITKTAGCYTEVVLHSSSTGNHAVTSSLENKKTPKP